jgi:ABC-type glycerol-3-phosphate transport system substrate-binding protein
MILSIVPGCSKTENKPTDATAAATTTDTQGTTDAIPEKTDMEISIYNWAVSEFDPTKDEIAKFINDKFKITFKVITYDGEDAIKLAAASKSLPDVFDTGPLYNPQLYAQWITQGIVRDIPESLINKYPLVAKQVQDRMCQVTKKLAGGKYYLLPRPSSSDPELYKVSWEGLYYRKDWLANAGITKVPSTFDELYQMLKAFKEGDPDKNGKNDTQGMTFNTLGMLSNWFCAWGINTEDWVSEDGKWIPGYTSKKVVEPLKYIQKLYQEGLIDPEFSSNGAAQAMQKFAGNTYGAIQRNSDTYWLYRVIVREFGGANKSVSNPLDVVGCIPTLAKDATSQPLRAEYVTYDAVQFNGTCPDDKLDRFLEFYDWLLGDEAKYLCGLGFEGRHYQKTADGKVVTFNDPATGAPYDIVKLFPFAGIVGVTDWGFDHDSDFGWPSVNIRDNIKQLSKEMRDARNPNLLPANIELRLVSTPSKDTLNIDFMSDFSNMVMSTENMDAQFAAFIEKVMATGGQQAIEEVTAEASKLGLQ